EGGAPAGAVGRPEGRLPGQGERGSTPVPGGGADAAGADSGLRGRRGSAPHSSDDGEPQRQGVSGRELSAGAFDVVAGPAGRPEGRKGQVLRPCQAGQRLAG